MITPATSVMAEVALGIDTNSGSYPGLLPPEPQSQAHVLRHDAREAFIVYAAVRTQISDIICLVTVFRLHAACTGWEDIATSMAVDAKPRQFMAARLDRLGRCKVASVRNVCNLACGGP